MFLILNVRTSLQPDLLAADADEYSVTRSLETYLLWLFGYIMFNNSHGHCVDRVLLPYAQEIADADEDAIPLYSWGSAVLACTYRGLCKASRQNDRNAVLTGVPNSAIDLVLREDCYRSSHDSPVTVQAGYVR